MLGLLQDRKLRIQVLSGMTSSGSHAGFVQGQALFLGLQY